MKQDDYSSCIGLLDELRDLVTEGNSYEETEIQDRETEFLKKIDQLETLLDDIKEESN